MGDLPESRDWGGGGGEGGGEWGTVRERETYYSLEVKDVVGGGGEGLPRVEGCSMGALSNLHFFCVGWSASSW